MRGALLFPPLLCAFAVAKSSSAGSFWNRIQESGFGAKPFLVVDGNATSKLDDPRYLCRSEKELCRAFEHFEDWLAPRALQMPFCSRGCSTSKDNFDSMHCNGGEWVYFHDNACHILNWEKDDRPHVCLDPAEKRLACKLSACVCVNRDCRGLTDFEKTKCSKGREFMPVLPDLSDLSLLHQEVHRWITSLRSNRNAAWAVEWATSSGDVAAAPPKPCLETEDWLPCRIKAEAGFDGMCVGLDMGVPGFLKGFLPGLGRSCWAFLDMERSVSDYVACQAGSEGKWNCGAFKILIYIALVDVLLFIALLVYIYFRFIRQKPLPREWKEAKLGNKKVYYWNRYTGETTWVRPA